jgi:glycosyl transferase family 25
MINLGSLMSLPIYVISVKSFEDRHAHIEKMAARMGFEFEYVWPFDADELTENDLRMVDPALRPRSASNALKHLHAQRMFLESDQDIALILEDDVVLFESFFEALVNIVEQSRTLAPGWLIFLGGADNKVDQRFFESDDLLLIEKPLTTAEAYLVDKYGCELRARWLETHIIDRQADHQLKLMDQELGLRHFCVSKPLATQGSITGLFDTALDSSRAKHGPLFLKTKYEYNRFRRQIWPRFWMKMKRALVRS